MKKNLFLVHWLVLIMFLTTVVMGTHAQQLEYPSAKEAVKSVLWELAKDAAGVTCPPALMLTAMEILTIDAQVYTDIPKGLYWSSNVNRQHEYRWGDRVTLIVPPQGKELLEIIKIFNNYGCFSKDEFDETKMMVDYRISKVPLTIDDLLPSVRDKINAALEIALSKNRSEIIFNVKAKLKEEADDKKTIVGDWDWFNGRTASFDAEGNASASGYGGTHTWELTNPEKREYTIQWEGGISTDIVTLSIDGNKLDGNNVQQKIKVSGIRQKD